MVPKLKDDTKKHFTFKQASQGNLILFVYFKVIQQFPNGWIVMLNLLGVRLTMLSIFPRDTFVWGAVTLSVLI